MADLLITKRRNLVLIVANSDIGKTWLANNIISTNTVSVTIQSDLLEDFILNLNEAGITYDEL